MPSDELILGWSEMYEPVREIAFQKFAYHMMLEIEMFLRLRRLDGIE
jgi:hypothetical protein